MKEKQKQLLSEMMQEDEKLGLYDETLKEAAEYYSENWEEITGLDYENSIHLEVNKIDFINGAKWQQKQNSDKKYSEDELLNILNEYNYAIINEDRINTIGTVKKWFEQFSKLKNG